MCTEPDNVAVNSGNIADDCRISVFPHILCNFAVEPFCLELLRGINYNHGFKMFVPYRPAFGHCRLYARKQFAVLGSIFILVELFAAVRKCFVILASGLALAYAVFVCFHI